MSHDGVWRILLDCVVREGLSELTLGLRSRCQEGVSHAAGGLELRVIQRRENSKNKSPEMRNKHDIVRG